LHSLRLIEILHYLCTQIFLELMTTIECTNEKLALNLNPYQIYVFVNEKTKPYLDQIKRGRVGDYHIELIPFDVEKDSQAVVGEDVDPLLYYSITHSDLFARVMPLKAGDYRYTCEMLFKEKDYSNDCFYLAVNHFAQALNAQKSKSFVNTLRRYFQYGNEEFYDFLMEVYEGDLSKIMEMSKYYSNIVSSAAQTSAENFLADFMHQLSKDKREQLLSLVKDSLGYANEKDSKLLLCNYLQYKYTSDAGGGFSNLTNASKEENELKEPDFSLIIEYNKKEKKEKLKKKEGDYDIILKKDNGDRINLEFGHRGDKMLYLLTLLCQKARGGLPTAYFNNERAKQVIKAVYDRLYGSGGEEWVEKCSNKTHNISTYRSHAKEAIEDDERLEPHMAFWCNFENKTIFIGEKGNKPLEIRTIRLPKERIEIHDGKGDFDSLSDIIEKLPHLECLYGLSNVTHPELFEIYKNLACGVDQREDNSPYAIRE